MDPLELAAYVQAQVEQARMLLHEDEIGEIMGECIPPIERLVERFDDAGVPAAIADIVFSTLHTTFVAMVRMDKAGHDDWSPS
jgi:hypothetical protein